MMWVRGSISFLIKYLNIKVKSYKCVTLAETGTVLIKPTPLIFFMQDYTVKFL
jgi:hypothetical protein